MDETDGVKSINPAMLQVAAMLVDLPVTTIERVVLEWSGQFPCQRN